VEASRCGVKGQLGLEASFQQYIERLRDIFDEAGRMLIGELPPGLFETGVCFVRSSLLMGPLSAK